jgi:hypothetical protein
MELSPFWETASCVATQEVEDILWHSVVYYGVHKSRPLLPILSQINPFHITQPIFLRSILILLSNLRLGISSGLFPPGFPTKVLYTFIIFMHATYLVHHILLDMITAVCNSWVKIASGSLQITSHRHCSQLKQQR